MADDPQNTQYQDNQGDLDVPEQPLPQDFSTPAAPPTDVPADNNFADTPQADSGVDEHEKYDAGEATASGANAQEDEQHDEEERVA